MKLLKFVNGDAPQTFASMHFDGKQLSFPGLNKRWVASKAAATSGSYWLLDDSGAPVCLLNDVLVLKGELTADAVPTAIRDDHVAGVDLRSKLGRQLESSRAEYGSTYKTAAANAAVQMNADEEKEKRQEKTKRERTAVADQIERGEEPAGKKSRKDSSKSSKKSGH